MPEPPSRWRILAAFAAIYLIWGSTYLAIRFTVETIPPFTGGAIRFLVSGVALYGWATVRGASRGTYRQWKNAAIVGILLLFLGNGTVMWASRRIPSGFAALLIATTPFWMALFEWLRPKGTKPNLGVVLGLVFGTVGMGILIGPQALIPGVRPDLWGSLAALFAALSWAGGSLYSRHADLPESPFLSTGMQMLIGGVLLLAVSAVSGEAMTFEPSDVSLRSALSLGYLIGVGSFVGFTSYMWLLKVSTPVRVSTYAYVNPAVAVFLGWAFGGEALTPRVLLASAVIVAAVVLITTYRSRKMRLASELETPSD